MGQFKPMPKMETTEPSVELKLKKGGRAKKMAEGGKMDEAQDKAMIKKAFKEHDAQEHKGGKGTKLKLRGGGMAPKAGPNVMGGLAGGISATRPDKKGMTGNIELSKYKKGGQALAKKRDSFSTKTTLKPKIDVKDKVVSAERNKSAGKKTGSIELAKFKRGGAVASKGMSIANKYETKINDASSSSKVKGGTGGIEGSKYKAGGHVAMTCKSTGGFTAMKKMQKC